MEREWDEVEEKVHHDVHEPTTFELAEAEYRSEQELAIKNLGYERNY